MFLFRKNPKVEKYRSAVHELYMRPYNYVSYEMGGSSPTQYRYQYHTPSYPSNQYSPPSSFPSQGSAYQPSNNHATFHTPPSYPTPPPSAAPASDPSIPSSPFSVFQNTPYSFHEFDTKLGKA